MDENPASATEGTNSWAVVIGIENCREQLAPAEPTENDAKAFERFVIETLRVPPQQIKLLEGDRASRGGIASALEEWLPRNGSATPDGTVYVLFSGYGTSDVETGDAYWSLTTPIPAI